MLPVSPRFLFFLAATLFLNCSASAQDKLLTLDDLYDPEKRVNFSGNPPPALIWLDDGHYLQGARKVNALTGESAPLFDDAQQERSLPLAVLIRNSAEYMNGPMEAQCV